MFYVYILKSKKDGKLYIGYTSNLRIRISQHNKGENKSTAHRRPFFLVYYEAFSIKSDALKREKNLKQFKNSYKKLKDRISDSLQA